METSPPEGAPGRPVATGLASLGPEAYRALYENSPDGVLFTVPDGRVLAANATACVILGRTEAEICQLGRAGLADADDERWGPLLAERQRTGHAEGIARMVRGDGGLIEIEMSTRVFREADGQQRTCTIIRDVSGRVALQRALDRERQALADAQATAGIGSWEWHVGQKRVVWSDELYRILGVEPTVEVTFEAFLQRVHTDDRSRIREMIEHGLNAREGFTFEHRAVTPAGETRVLSCRGEVIVGSDGSVLGMRGTALDVTEQRAVEQRQRESHARLQALLDYAPFAISLRDLEGRFLLVNRHAADLLGETPERILGRVPAEVHDPAVAAEIATQDRNVRAGDDAITYELSGPDADGFERDFFITKYPVTDEDGTLVGIGGISLDISDRRRAERELRQAEETRRRLAAIIENTGDAVIAKSAEGIIEEWNHGAERLFGYTAAEAIGVPAAALILPPDRVDEEGETLRRVISTGRVEHYETVRVCHTGERLDVSVTASPIRDHTGAIVAVSTISRDVSERKRFEGQLQHLADHDALTGLFNRRRFEAELDRELARADRYGTGGALMVLDVDHFKYINDSLGHAVGDKLITQVGAIFRGRLRSSDILARLGGDEFAILLPGANAAEARLVASNILQALRLETSGPRRIGRRSVTASIGIALFTGEERLVADELLVRADIAMYDAKEAGRDRAMAYDAVQARPTVMQARLTWADRIRAAIDEDRFLLHAQPILSLTDDSKPRHELLLRMIGENGDPIPPASFLSIAERFDLITDIDRWVLHKAIGVLAQEQRAGHDIRINVNISAQSLVVPDLAEVVARELDDARADGTGLCIEITETGAIVNIARAKRFAAEINALGCQLALDDFGAGFASFYYLKHLAFDYLKIDGEFIADLAESPTNQLIVRSIVDIARGMDKHTVAEFVGNSETLDLLREYHVDYAQGYHINRPAPFTFGDLARTPGVFPPPARRSH